MSKQFFIVPRCENCGKDISGLCVERSNFEIAPSAMIQIIKRLAPSTCPNCGLIFSVVEVDTNNKTVIVKGALKCNT